MRDLSRIELECLHHGELIMRVLDLQHQRLVWAKATEATCVRNVKLANTARGAIHLTQETVFVMSMRLSEVCKCVAEVVKDMMVMIQETEGE